MHGLGEIVKMNSPATDRKHKDHTELPGIVRDTLKGLATSERKHLIGQLLQVLANESPLP